MLLLNLKFVGVSNIILENDKVLNLETDDVVLGVVGSGAMGRGIAQIAVLAGIKVIIYDSCADNITQAVEFINKMLSRAVEKGRINTEQAVAAKNNLIPAKTLNDLAAAKVIVEAIVENLDAKRALFSALEQIVDNNCILATNTSSLAVTMVAQGCKHPERVAGFHFFNPVPLMKLVEVIAGACTAGSVIQQLLMLAKRMGHHPVQVKDMPGFLVNHMGRGLNTEGLRVLQENATSADMVDAIIRDCIGFKMGPFELMDLTGLDVTFPVSELLYEQFYHEPRLRPTPLLRQRFASGMLGRKTKEGFYRYKDGVKIIPKELTAPDVAVVKPIWISNAEPDLAETVKVCLMNAGVEIDFGVTPAPESICLVTPVGSDTSTAAFKQQLDPQRTIAIDALFLSEKRITLMTSPATLNEVRDIAWAALAKTGKMVVVIRDSAGFVAQRVIATIINIVSDIAQQGIALPNDIDIAAKYGLGYPKGPLELGDQLGAVRIVQILESMQEIYGDSRYRPSPWLRRRAQLGLSLKMLEF